MAEQLASDEGANLISIPIQRGISPLADIVSLFRLTWALGHLRPSIAEFSTPKAGLLGSLAAFLCRVPSRVYLLRGLRLETSSGLKRAVLKASEKLAAACAHTVVCNSESLRRQTIDLRLAPGSKLKVLGGGSSNGVDIVKFTPGPDTMRAKLGIPAGAPVVGFVGRLTRDKGIPELLEAFNRLLEKMPDTRLLLVGWFDESEDALSVYQRARIEAHPRIIRTGFVANTAPYYRAMDLLVLPTWREGFPNAVLEAAAAGLPVITTQTTGARDAVLPGLTGVLVPPGEPLALAEALLSLLQHPERRLSMGATARQWVVQEFGNRRVLGLTVNLYLQLLRQADTRNRRRAPEPALLRQLAKDAVASGD
ncbi:glycosyltransferase family 4 protein [Occallatibacter riparius]|uniref:Glycosyltransferase family 4 protein n=2 Tax=Occallatibacter riparius TaxID=1002689 RepID=A0A9J7BJP6_9BACT|nr:glycosyltransferase family 4 protein [Occallatibacter riparius]